MKAPIRYKDLLPFNKYGQYLTAIDQMNLTHTNTYKDVLIKSDKEILGPPIKDDPNNLRIFINTSFKNYIKLWVLHIYDCCNIFKGTYGSE